MSEVQTFIRSFVGIDREVQELAKEARRNSPKNIIMKSKSLLGVRWNITERSSEAYRKKPRLIELILLSVCLKICS